MAEISSIADITRLEVIKVKRSSRKGRITRLKTNAEATRIGTLSSKTLNNLQEDLFKEIRIYNALQARYEQLLAEKETPESQLAEEMETALDMSDAHVGLQRRVEELRVVQAHYTDALQLCAEHDTSDQQMKTSSTSSRIPTPSSTTDATL